MGAYELTILLPCLNEAETLAQCIQKAQAFLAHEQVQGEILVADNGSTDGSQAIARQQGVRVISVAVKGYGAALKAGIRAALGRYVIVGDADDSYDFFDLKPFLVHLRAGYDLVMGNRFKGGIVSGAMPALNRYLGNPILSCIGRLFFHSQIGDFHCGLRGFCRYRLMELDLQGDGMEFASEMVVKATLQQLKMIEVPIKLFPDGRTRRSHLQPWRDGWRHLRLLLLLSPRWLFLYPGLFLLGSGLLLMLLLLSGPFKIGRLHLDIHTMLFAGLLMIVGLQAICFSAFATFIAAFHVRQVASRLLKALKSFTLERGLTVGLLLIFTGSIGSCYTFWHWLHHAFGSLIPTQTMRVFIPSIILSILGVQFMFASFFMSLLHLNYPPAPRENDGRRLK